MIGRDDPWFVHLTNHYAALVRHGIPFAEASYGDGEFLCIMGRTGANCDGTKYEPGLQEALVNTLLRPAGIWCSFFDVPGPTRDSAVAWVEKNCPPIHWVAQRAVGRAAEIGRASPFFQAARTRSVVLVGPSHLADLPPNVIGSFQHIEVPATDAWREVDDIASRVRELVHPWTLVLFAAGMASNILIHRLWGASARSATLVDVGALLDPYCGVFSRNYQRDLAWQRDTMPRNLA